MSQERQELIIPDGPKKYYVRVTNRADPTQIELIAGATKTEITQRVQAMGGRCKVDFFSKDGFLQAWINQYESPENLPLAYEFCAFPAMGSPQIQLERKEEGEKFAYSKVSIGAWAKTTTERRFDGHGTLRNERIEDERHDPVVIEQFNYKGPSSTSTLTFSGGQEEDTTTPAIIKEGRGPWGRVIYHLNASPEDTADQPGRKVQQVSSVKELLRLHAESKKR